MGAHSAVAVVPADPRLALVNVGLTVLVLVARHTQALIVIHSILQPTNIGQRVYQCQTDMGLLVSYNNYYSCMMRPAKHGSPATLI